MSFAYDVLLVEDNEAERELFRRSCSSSAYPCRLHEVGDGEAALDFLFKRGIHAHSPTPDVILLDLNLPRVQGKEVLRQIKSTDNLRIIPVIILTGSLLPEDVDECYGLGASAYVRKPDEYDSFCSVVERLEKFWFDVAVLPVDRTKQRPATRSALAR
jgi:CheY-like chemotaxis protein